jgi:hypothetical protein
VGTADVSLLGAHYGAAITGPEDANACLDVGPTTDYSTQSRPTPDGVLEFEDLVLFALNYTGGPGTGPAAAGARARTAPAVAGANALQLQVGALPKVGETFAVAVRATGKGDVQALRLELGYDGSVLEMVKAESGELLDRQVAQALVLSPKPGRVDLALLGKGAGLSGEGTLVTATFKVLAAGDPKIRIASLDGRDTRNQKVALSGSLAPQGPVIPKVTMLWPARPNPFSQTVTLSFSLSERGPVELVIYSVAGRQVRTLARGDREPGEYSLVWDGRDDGGSAMSTGVYYVHLVTAQHSYRRTVTYLK